MLNAQRSVVLMLAVLSTTGFVRTPKTGAIVRQLTRNRVVQQRTRHRIGNGDPVSPDCPVPTWKAPCARLTPEQRQIVREAAEQYVLLFDRECREVKATLLALLDNGRSELWVYTSHVKDNPKRDEWIGGETIHYTDENDVVIGVGGVGLHARTFEQHPWRIAAFAMHEAAHVQRSPELSEAFPKHIETHCVSIQ